MTSVASAIASLLYDHDTVIVPGLGAFVRHNRSAQVNVITNEFQRPSSQLDFDSRQREENSLVGDFLAATDGLTNDEARTAVATFVSDCFVHLKEEGKVSLPGIGTITMDEEQDLVFEPDENNFNGDAFGLEDINPEPVYGTGRGEPVCPPEPNETVSAEEVSTRDTRDPNAGLFCRRRIGWIWVVLLLLAAAGVALWYFKFRPVPTKPWPLPDLQPRERVLPQRPIPETDTLALVEPSAITPDSIAEPDSEPTPETTPEIIPEPTPDPTPETVPEVAPKPQGPGPVEVVKPEPTSKAFIVGGCFAVEQNALNMTTEARAQGCAEAFVMKRGSKFFVCYGQYPSTAEAKAALPEVLAQYNAKAWILTK